MLTCDDKELIFHPRSTIRTSFNYYFFFLCYSLFYWQQFSFFLLYLICILHVIDYLSCAVICFLLILISKLCAGSTEYIDIACSRYYYVQTKINRSLYFTLAPSLEKRKSICFFFRKWLDLSLFQLKSSVHLVRKL